MKIDESGAHILEGSLGTINDREIGPGHVVLSEDRYRMLLECFRAAIVKACDVKLQPAPPPAPQGDVAEAVAREEAAKNSYKAAYEMCETRCGVLARDLNEARNAVAKEQAEIIDLISRGKLVNDPHSPGTTIVAALDEEEIIAAIRARAANPPGQNGRLPTPR